jgi:hypothetical protein
MLQSYNNNFSIIIQEQKETNVVLKTNQVNEQQIQQLLKDNQQVINRLVIDRVFELEIGTGGSEFEAG